ncbi:MAG: hypothetical protein EXQ47_12125 [Bryobacterales bacterium]|nr:hypothetical protein [Bryobacterales bacterium]
MSDLDQVRALVKAKDVRNALVLIADIESHRGPSARLFVLRALCLQLSDDASPEDVERALNSALSSDDEYVDAHLEMGWFRLVMLDDAEGAKAFFKQATGLLAKLNEEVVRGLLACDEELSPGRAPEAAKIQYQDALIRAEPEATRTK